MASRLSAALLLPLTPAMALVACDSQTHSEDAHVHGLARLTIAIDSDAEAQVVFESPSESIYGFEHEPRTPEEQAAQDDALATLETGFGDLLVLPEALGCTIASAEVSVEADDHGDHDEDGHDEDGHDDEHEGEAVHTEVHATYALSCDAGLENAEAEVALGEAFAGIEELEVILLTAGGQTAERLEGGVGRVDW